MRLLKPSLAEEKEAILQGYRFVAGIDEVGRGALAGPVVAAAVILPDTIKPRVLAGIRDSKQLTPARRETLSEHIKAVATTFGIGAISREVIDEKGIAKATRLAMKLAVEQLMPSPDYILIDYFRLPEVSLPQKGVINGDSLCFSIAAASIIAKVARDHMMVELDTVYPGYGFGGHKGYSTSEHLECLRKLGASAVHRRSFQPVRDVCDRLF